MSDQPTAPTDRIGPSWLPMALVVLSATIAAVSVFSTWVRSQALDTDTWVETSDELLAEPEVQEQLATFLTNRLYERVGLQETLEERLPEDLQPLAAPLAGALRAPINNSVETLIASDAFASAWSAANRNAHATAVAILRDETPPGVSTADGTVTLDLGEALTVIGSRVGLSDDVLDRIPDDAGQITIFESEQLDNAQSLVRVLDVLSWFLFLVVVAGYATAVAIAPGRRVRVFRNIGLSLIVAGFAVIAIRALAVRGVVGAVADEPRIEPVATVASNVVTQLIYQSGWTGIISGLLITGIALLLGEHRWAVASRRVASPVIAGSVGATIGVALVLTLGLLWWSPGRVFDRWMTGLTLIAVVVGGVIALRLVTLDELEEPSPEEPSPEEPSPEEPTAQTSSA